MAKKKVHTPKGTTHLVSDDDFQAIAEYQEPDAESELIEYAVDYVLATRDGEDLVIRRSFKTQSAADDFKKFVKTKTGAKVI